MNDDNRNVVHVDAVVKFFGIVTTVVAVILAVYLHFVSMISNLESRIVEIEKQRIKDEKYNNYSEQNRIDIVNIQSDLRSMNDSMVELMRNMRANNQNR
jgi:HD superfamily phosphohydrolase